MCGRVLILYGRVQVDPDAVANAGEMLSACSLDVTLTQLQVEPRNPKPDNRNPMPETRYPKLDTRCPKPETRDPKPETRISYPKPETRYPKPETRNPKPERNPKSEIHFTEL